MGKLLPGKIPERNLDKIVWKKWQHGPCHKREMLHSSTGIPRSNTCLSISRLEIFTNQVSKIGDFQAIFNIEEPALLQGLIARTAILSLRLQIIPEII